MHPQGGYRMKKAYTKPILRRLGLLRRLTRLTLITIR